MSVYSLPPNLQPLSHIRNNRTCCQNVDWLIASLPMVFAMLINLIFSNQHLYVDNIQLFLVPLSQLWLKYHSPPEYFATDFLLDIRESSYYQLFLRLNFSLLVSRKQLSKIDNSSFSTTHSACKFDFIFAEHLTFSYQISSLSKLCYFHIHKLRYMRHYLDSKTATTITADITHFKLDHCNSLYHNLSKSQIKRIQLSYTYCD